MRKLFSFTIPSEVPRDTMRTWEMSVTYNKRVMRNVLHALFVIGMIGLTALLTSGMAQAVINSQTNRDMRAAEQEQRFEEIISLLTQILGRLEALTPKPSVSVQSVDSYSEAPTPSTEGWGAYHDSWDEKFQSLGDCTAYLGTLIEQGRIVQGYCWEKGKDRVTVKK